MFMFNYLLCLSLLTILQLSTVVNGNANEDKILHLPGMNHILNFEQYSGYLEGSEGDMLHYWFVTSQSNKTKDPLLLWLNGGPGCSSLDGFFQELGPFKINSDGSSLSLNPHSWNKKANILFLESPVCVGFSYRDDGDCSASDDSVSLTNYKALQNFFKKFPEFISNELFITGESYGGIYIPTLTKRIVEGLDSFKMNIQGFAVGNGLSSYTLNGDSFFFFGYYHGLFGKETWDSIIENCCTNSIPSVETCNFSKHQSKNCSYSGIGVKPWYELTAPADLLSSGQFKHQPHYTSLTVRLIDAISFIYSDSLNVYNIYDACLHPKESSNILSRYSMDMKNLLVSHGHFQEIPLQIFTRLFLDPPCTDSTAMKLYLNNPEVRKAIHVKDVKWEVCNAEVNHNYVRQYTTMKEQYFYLTNHVRALVYNGDVDMACNFLGDEWFVESLNLTQKAPRKAWYHAGQIGGFVKRFNNLDIVTIRGAGHMVPQDKPGPAYQMISAFIDNKDY